MNVQYIYNITICHFLRLNQLKQLGQYEDQKNYKKKVDHLIQSENIVDYLVKMRNWAI